MKKPRILLSGNKGLQNYADAVKLVGAEPIAKYLPTVDTKYDGLILCGGNDINPSYYNQEIDGAVCIDAARDELEFSLLKAYIKAGKPVLGICRGFQLINIFFGGSLYQHLPETNLHRGEKNEDVIHNVITSENSVLCELYGREFLVNSFHHQAINKLGSGLCATAYWNDKYIEAYEHISLPVFAVQWHPERLCGKLRRQDAVDGVKIFKYFIDICKNG